MDRITRAARDAEVMLQWHSWLKNNDDLNQYGDLSSHVARKIRIQREHVRMHATTSGR